MDNSHLTAENSPVSASLRQKEQLYHELSQLSRSGLPLVRALDILGQNTRTSAGRQARRVSRQLQNGGAVGPAFQAGGLGADDAAVLEAGEQTGRLPDVFAELSAFYGQLAAMRQQMITRSLYPLFVFHAGAILLSIPPALLGGGWPVFFRSAVMMLGGLYAVLAVIFLGGPFLQSLFATSPLLARIFGAVPLLGRFLTDWAGWKFASVLALFVRSGGGLLRGFQVAARVGGNADTAARVAVALPLVQNGGRLSEALRGRIPEPLERALQVGEETGRFDVEIARAAEILKARTLHSLELAAEWIPRLVYLAICLFLAWQIIDTVLQITGAFHSALDVESM